MIPKWLAVIKGQVVAFGVSIRHLNGQPICFILWRIGIWACLVDWEMLRVILLHYDVWSSLFRIQMFHYWADLDMLHCDAYCMISDNFEPET